MANKLTSYEEFLDLARKYTKYCIPTEYQQKCDDNSIDASYGLEYALNILLIKAGITNEVLFAKLNPNSDNKMISVEGIELYPLSLADGEYIIPHDNTQNEDSLKKKLRVRKAQSKIIYTAHINEQVSLMYTKLSKKSIIETLKDRDKYDRRANYMYSTLKTKYPWLPLTRLEILVGTPYFLFMSPSKN